MARKRKSPVDSLKDELYSRSEAPNTDPSARTPLSQAHEETPRAWQDIRQSAAVAEQAEASAGGDIPPEAAYPVPPMTTRKKHSLAGYFLLGSLAFFIIAAAVAFATFWNGGNTISSQNIDLQIVAPSLIDSGKQATIEFLIDNKNDATLQAADLVIDYPAGTRDAQNPTQSLTHQRLTVGNIAPGAQVKETVPALFYGSEGAQENINATLEYQLAGSNAVFTRPASTMLTIGSAPVSLSVSSSDQAISGQLFSMDITVTSNTAAPLQNVAVEAQYPFGFAVQSSTPQADVGNTLWRLGTLSPGNSKTIHLTGTLTGEDGDERVFHFLVGSETDLTESTLAIPLLSVPQTIVVHKPFISGQISLDGQTGTTIAEPLGRTLQGAVNWQNNSSSTVSNVTLALALSGQALDPSSVQADTGFWDSTKSQILWSSAQDPDLVSVPPGASGTLSFSFATYPPSAQQFINPELNLNLTVHATRTDQSGAPSDISSAAQTSVTLASSVALAASSLHFSGPFADSGPVPPKVGQPTTYTIVWTVKNSSNTVAGSEVKTVLPIYMTYVSADTSAGERVSYDDPTRTVTWDLGDVKAGAGYSAPMRQASFQVTLTPSLSQVGQVPALTGDASFSGEDRFAQATVQADAPAPTTHTSDTNLTQGMDTVSQ